MIHKRHIFLSYRREDSAYVAATIRERLEQYFGPESVFMDVDSIPFGVDFRRQLDAAVARCDVLLAVIGDNWFTSHPQANTRRIDDPTDYIRIEIESALRRNIPVIPVLVGSAAMPRENELPDSIKDLAFRNNTEIRPGRDLTDHLNRLVQGLQRLFETQAEAPYKAEKKQTLIEGSLLSQLSYTASRILSDLTSSRSASTTKDQAPGIRSGSPKQFAMPSERPVARTKIALYFVLGAILLALIYMYLDQVVMETDYGAWPLLVGATIVSIVAAIMSKHLVLAPLSCLLAIFADLILVGFLHDWQSLDLLITIPLAILCSIPSVVIVILSRRHIQHQHGPNVEVE